MSDRLCVCDMRTKFLGDGCSVYPHFYIEILERQSREDSIELDRLRAENARQRAWIDGVMAELIAARIAGTGDASVTLYGSGLAFGTELITRPAPFEDK